MEGSVLRKEHREDEAGDSEIHGRTGQADPKFLPRFGGPFQSRDAADGVHHDLDGSNAVVRADQGVGELMQQHGSDQSQHEEGIARGRLITPEADHDQKDQQQDDGEM